MQKKASSHGSLAQDALSHLDGLYGYAMSLCRQSAEAEDLVQETYVRAMKSKDQLSPDSNVKAWLYAILRNAWLNQVRHSQSGPRLVELSDEEGAEPAGEATRGRDPYDCYVTQAQCHDVRAAIERLPALYREVILLREFEDLSYQEISQIVGIPAGTVMSRLGRARERLRLALSQWEGPAAGPGRPGATVKEASR